MPSPRKLVDAWRRGQLLLKASLGMLRDSRQTGDKKQATDVLVQEEHFYMDKIRANIICLACIRLISNEGIGSRSSVPVLHGTTMRSAVLAGFD